MKGAPGKTTMIRLRAKTSSANERIVHVRRVLADKGKAHVIVTIDDLQSGEMLTLNFHRIGVTTNRFPLTFVGGGGRFESSPLFCTWPNDGNASVQERWRHPRNLASPPRAPRVN